MGNSGVHHNHCIDYEFKKRKTNLIYGGIENEKYIISM